MPEPPDLAAIIVSHGHGATLGRALRSLGRLGDELGEIVVVDNAGDLDAAGLRAVAGITPRLLAPGENLGFAAAVNLAANEVRSGVLVLLSPDAEVVGWDRERIMSDLERPTGALGALTLDREDRPSVSWGEFPGARSLWRRLTLRRAARRRSMLGRLARGERVAVDWALGAALLIPRSGLEAVGGLEPRYRSSGEDQDLGARLERQGLRTLVSPGWVVRHEPRDPSSMRREIRANNRRFVARHGTVLDRAAWALASLPETVGRWPRGGPTVRR